MYPLVWSKFTASGLLALMLIALALEARAQDQSLQDQDETASTELDDEPQDQAEESASNHSATHWSYTDQTDWAKEFPTCKGVMHRQSPIDIVTDQVVLKNELQLELIDYNQQVEFQLKNNHHTISLTPIASGATPTVMVNWLPPDDNLFELQEVHFHWGNNLNKGSEHEVNGEQTAAEMHMVHYKKGMDKSLAGTTNNSVVVIGVLIDTDPLVEPKLDLLVKNAQFVNGTDLEYISPEHEPLAHLLPDNHHSFFTYEGSLTTPPCYEVVTWIVMHDRVYMSQDRLVELTNFEANLPGGRQKINSNRRDVQPLLDRQVYASYSTIEISTTDGQAAAHKKRKFSQAFESYWSRMKNITGSVKRRLAGQPKALS